jgi:hypothetical protein
MAPPPPRPPKNSGGASVFEYQRPMHRPSLGQPSVAVEPMRASFAQTSSRGYGQRAASEYQMPSHTLDSSQPLQEQGIGSIPSSTQRRSQSHPTDERIMPSIEDEVTIKFPRSSSVADQLRGTGRSRSSVTKSGETVTLRNSLIGVLKLEKSGNYGWATEGTTEDSLPDELTIFLEERFLREISTDERARWWNSMNQTGVESHIDANCVLGSIIGRSTSKNITWTKWGHACSTCVKKKRPCAILDLRPNGQQYLLGFLPIWNAVTAGVHWTDPRRYVED